jgi:hypothetical protein
VLTQSWNAEDEGEVADLLNVEISNADGVVELKQTGYIEKLAQTYLPGGNPSTGPAFSSKTLRTPAGPELVQDIADTLTSRDIPEADLLKQYQSLVGSLIYCATHTRPDVAYSVGMLCRAMAFPNLKLLRHAERVLCYLIATRRLGLRYVADQRDVLGSTDSDWSVDRSTSGQVFRYCQAAISWGSKRQTSIALSSCEAEIMAASEASKEAVYLAAFLEELGVRPGNEPVTLQCDNQCAIDVSYNPEHYNRMKHVQRRHFFVRELVEEGRIVVPFVRSADNVADMFTKPLAYPAFRTLRDRIMNADAVT